MLKNKEPAFDIHKKESIPNIQSVDLFNISVNSLCTTY